MQRSGKADCRGQRSSNGGSKVASLSRSGLGCVQLPGCVPTSKHGANKLPLSAASDNNDFSNSFRVATRPAIRGLIAKQQNAVRVTAEEFTMITFNYRRALAADRGELPKLWLAALANTGRFVRNQRSQPLFVLNREPFEWCQIGRREEFWSILESEENNFLTITGDALDDSDRAGLWFWFHDRRWKLPRIDARTAAMMEKVRA
jgi:hypothetical protein